MFQSEFINAFQKMKIAHLFIIFNWSVGKGMKYCISSYFQLRNGMFYISYAQFNPNNIIRCDKHTACGWMGAFKNQTHCLWTDLGSYDSLQDFGIGGGREDLES